VGVERRRRISLCPYPYVQRALSSPLIEIQVVLEIMEDSENFQIHFMLRESF
jgi:hypothetical protein